MAYGESRHMRWSDLVTTGVLCHGRSDTGAPLPGGQPSPRIRSRPSSYIEAATSLDTSRVGGCSVSAIGPDAARSQRHGRRRRTDARRASPRGATSPRRPVLDGHAQRHALAVLARHLDGDRLAAFAEGDRLLRLADVVHTLAVHGHDDVARSHARRLRRRVVTTEVLHEHAPDLRQADVRRIVGVRITHADAERRAPSTARRTSPCAIG